MIKKTNDGSYLIVNHSVAHPAVMPKKDYIRSFTPWAGFVLRPVGANSTTVCYLNMAEIPYNKVITGVARKLMRRRALNVFKLRELVLKKRKENTLSEWNNFLELNATLSRYGMQSKLTNTARSCSHSDIFPTGTLNHYIFDSL